MTLKQIVDELNQNDGPHEFYADGESLAYRLVDSRGAKTELIGGRANK
jgi:hypothetical protein